MMIAHARYCKAVLAGLAALVGMPFVSGADPAVDSVMDRSPELHTPKLIKVFPKGLIDSWVGVLDGPNVDMKCAAAQSIAYAHSQGMTGLEASIPKLVQELNRMEAHRATRLAVAHALIALDAKQAADSMFRLLTSSDDAELRELIEPALTRWDFHPIRDVWLERLRRGPPYRHAHLLAIQGLGTVREEKAISTLRELVHSPTVPAAVRLEAARALGTISTSGLEKEAAELLADASPQGASGRLAAASLLRKHKGDEAVRLLQTLGANPEPALAAVALDRLVEIDTKLVVPILQQVLANPDANARAFGVVVLFQQATDPNIRLLAARLSDPHPQVRSQARRALHDLAARLEFRALIVDEGTKVLAGSDWRGQEQAAILLAHLDHKPAAKRLLELLAADRPEASLAAAWALRKLAVPDTLPAVFDFVSRQNKKLLTFKPTPNRATLEAIDRQLSQLVQFLGQARYRPSDLLLQTILPRNLQGGGRNPVEIESRSAAAWALGMIHEGDPDSTVVRLLEARLVDNKPGPAGSEFDRVRQMAALSLGRMKAKNSLQTLEQFYEGKPTFNCANNACGWAIEQITGRAVPAPGTVNSPVVGWFLYSIE
jgi:HEAT repeat protein